LRRPISSSSRHRCRRRAPARSCAASCARSPRTTSARSATPRRSPIRPWSTTSSPTGRTSAKPRPQRSSADAKRRTRGETQGSMQRLIFAAALLVSTALAAAAQLSASDELFTYYYKDPRPDRLVGFLTQYETRVPAEKWDPYPPVAGFFALVFQKHPQQ